jgi:hypothetical protein
LITSKVGNHIIESDSEAPQSMLSQLRGEVQLHERSIRTDTDEAHHNALTRTA